MFKLSQFKPNNSILTYNQNKLYPKQEEQNMEKGCKVLKTTIYHQN